MSAAVSAPPAVLLGDTRGGVLTDGIRDGPVFYPADVLGGQLVGVGGTGSGKTETMLGRAHGAAVDLGWQVLYLDANGDPANVARFVDAMQHAGRDRVRVFSTVSNMSHRWSDNCKPLLSRP